MTFDQDLFRRAMGRFATGITVITGSDQNGTPLGLTVNAFSSVSLDPPLVLVCLGKNTRSLEAFTEGKGFNVNLLTADQQDVSNVFASRSDDKFQGVETQVTENGLPAIADSLALIECDREAVYPGGDHEILIGRVTNIILGQSIDPLLYYRSRYAGIQSD